MLQSTWSEECIFVQTSFMFYQVGSKTSHCDLYMHDVWVGVLPQEMAFSSESYENFVN
jgi:hypothetical protein